MNAPGHNRNDDNLHVGPFLQEEPKSERVNTKLKIGRCKGGKEERKHLMKTSNTQPRETSFLK